MQRELKCPQCGRAGPLPERMDGRTVRCSQCGATVEIPAAAESQGEPQAAVPARRAPQRRPPAATSHASAPRPERTRVPVLALGAGVLVVVLLLMSSGFVYSWWTLSLVQPVLSNPSTVGPLTFHPGAVAGSRGFFSTRFDLTDSRVTLDDVRFVIPQMALTITPGRLVVQIPEANGTADGPQLTRVDFRNSHVTASLPVFSPAAPPTGMVLTHDELHVWGPGGRLVGKDARVTVVREKHTAWDQLTIALAEVVVGEESFTLTLRDVELATTQEAGSDGRLAVTFDVGLGPTTLQEHGDAMSFTSQTQQVHLAATILGDRTTNVWRTLDVLRDPVTGWARYTSAYKPRVSSFRWTQAGAELREDTVHAALSALTVVYDTRETGADIIEEFTADATGFSVQQDAVELRAERLHVEGSTTYDRALRDILADSPPGAMPSFEDLLTTVERSLGRYTSRVAFQGEGWSYMDRTTGMSVTISEAGMDSTYAAHDAVAEGRVDQRVTVVNVSAGVLPLSGLPQRFEQTASLWGTQWNLRPLIRWTRQVMASGTPDPSLPELEAAVNDMLLSHATVGVELRVDSDTAGGVAVTVEYTGRRALPRPGAFAALLENARGGQTGQEQELLKLLLDAGRVEATATWTDYQKTVAVIDSSQGAGMGSLAVGMISLYAVQEGDNLTSRLVIDGGRIEVNGTQIGEVGAFLGSSAATPAL